jgi:hypothetical protein
MTGVDKLQEGSKVNAQIPGMNPGVAPANAPASTPPNKAAGRKKKGS